ncbi:MAG: glycosyltransferase [Desulfobacteraceae bacterium]|nr:glycosyltransferase [Desulfobacteraceae bacterium]
MRTNILYIIERMEPGGTEKQLAALINRLQLSSNFRPYLCTLRPSSSFIDSISCQKIELDAQRLLSRKVVNSLKRLICFCKKHNIHIVQTFFQDSAIIGAALKCFVPVKLIGTFRDLGFWRSSKENFKMRLAYQMADGFLSNSEAVKSHFALTDRIKPEKIHVISNGFEKDKVADDTEFGKSDSENPVIGIVGNFNRAVKRMGDFIEVAALVKKRCKNAKFIVIGDGNQKDCLKRRCEELKIADSVEFTGRLDEPYSYIKQFTIGLNTSETEGFSNAVIEYMACGLAVVVTRAGGNKEMVGHGVNGFCVPVGDVEAMAGYVVTLIEDTDMRLRMGKNNISKVKTLYSMEKMIKKHQYYYLKLLAL